MNLKGDGGARDAPVEVENNGRDGEEAEGSDEKEGAFHRGVRLRRGSFVRKSCFDGRILVRLGYVEAC